MTVRDWPSSRHRRRVCRFLLLGLVMLAVVAMHHVAGPNRAGEAAPQAADAAPQSPDAAPGSAAAPGDQHRHPPAGDPGSGPAEHSPAQHMLNLCLAVLMAAALAGALWLLVTRVLIPIRPRRGESVPMAVRAGPPRRRHGFTLLLSLCVIRV